MTNPPDPSTDITHMALPLPPPVLASPPPNLAPFPPAAPALHIRNSMPTLAVTVRFGHKAMRPGVFGVLGLSQFVTGETRTWDVKMTDAAFDEVTPLVDRLTSRLLTRKGYKRLVALLVANALATGQVDETEIVMAALRGQWRRSPLRYLWF